MNLSRVTFGESSSKRIAVRAFSACLLTDVWIPDNVEELCDNRVYECRSLSHVTFGMSSLVKRIDVWAFSGRGLEEIEIPDGVEEVGEECFFRCKYLSCVRFGESSSLKRTGAKCFAHAGLIQFSLPAQVKSIGGAAFSKCPLNQGLKCDANCTFTVVNYLLLCENRRACCGPIGRLNEVVIPDSVEEHCN